MQYDFNFAPVFDAWQLLYAGLLVTLQLSFLAMAIGLVVSIALAWCRTSGPRAVQWLVAAYVELIRNTPFLVQIFFIFFGLPAVGVRMDPNTAALVALVVNVAAYATEIIRAGIEAIPRGQVEAGRALGMGPMQIFRYIILKPALRTIYPALTSQFIYLMLTSSVVSVISADDLAAAGNDIQSQTFAAFEVYLVITAIYFLLSMGFSGLFTSIGRIAFNYPMSR